MRFNLLTGAALTATLLLSSQAFSQTAAGVDPACMVKSANGTSTVDKTKCPDGMKVGVQNGTNAATSTDTATNKQNGTAGATSTDTANTSATNKQNGTAGATSTDTANTSTMNKQNGTAGATSTDTANTSTMNKQTGGKSATSTDTTATSGDTTASTTPIGKSMFVPQDQLTGASVMSANDFIGKRVYSRNGDDIGKVADLILTDDGSVSAVVLGVGGFLGIGTKDVAISMASIDMAKDGNSVKLVMDATKDQLKAAPTYDSATRTYIK